jgi:hypothetical protein
MQVLGELVKLPISDAIPLPWWHRAPLGLIHGTTVYVGISDRGEKRPVGELIVTVLNPKNWNKMVRVYCAPPDQPGILERKFGAIEPLNIALAETVTTSAGDLHDVNFLCEPYPGAPDDDYVLMVRKKLDELGFVDTKVMPHQIQPPPVAHRTGRVEHGWVMNVAWRKLMQRWSEEDRAKVDLKCAVVSADTRRRILRFVFPYKGVKSVRIEHADIPGALKRLTKALVDARTNILSALLRRGGAQPGNAILVAVCEPITPADAKNLKARIEEECRKIESSYQADWKITDGRPATDTISTTQPTEVLARVPDDLLLKVLKYKSEISKFKSDVPRRSLSVFFSRRFLRNDPYAEQIDNHIRDTLRRNGCYLVEAVPGEGGTRLTFPEVSARLWVADAGIVVIIPPADPETQGSSFSANLAHEFGFLQGQGKQVPVFVDRRCRDDEGLRSWSISHGIILHYFDHQNALNQNHPQSIDQQLERWIKWLKDHRAEQGMTFLES